MNRKHTVLDLHAVLMPHAGAWDAHGSCLSHLGVRPGQEVEGLLGHEVEGGCQMVVLHGAVVAQGMWPGMNVNGLQGLMPAHSAFTTTLTGLKIRLRAALCLCESS